MDPMLKPFAGNASLYAAIQVGPALILVQHLAPGSLDLFVEARNVVDAAGRQNERQAKPYNRNACLRQ